VFAPKLIKSSDKELYTGYKELVRSILAFFETGQPPVPEAETLEIFAFLDAAQRSKQAGGVPTPLR
jgi:hypothetical protein